jgi:hypothetical protein
MGKLEPYLSQEIEKIAYEIKSQSRGEWSRFVSNACLNWKKHNLSISEVEKQIKNKKKLKEEIENEEKALIEKMNIMLKKNNDKKEKEKEKEKKNQNKKEEIKVLHELRKKSIIISVMWNYNVSMPNAIKLFSQIGDGDHLGSKLENLGYKYRKNTKLSSSDKIREKQQYAAYEREIINNLQPA